MQITNDFSLALPPDRAYDLLLDLERVTPCLPGAELGDARDDGSRAVKVTVKLGPMRFVYDGTVRVAEQDDATRRAVLVGEARETRGQGSAKATITMTVSGANSASSVAAVADVDLTGRAAQMGRGVVEDVARRLIADLAACLESRFGRPSEGATSEAPGEPSSQPVSAHPLASPVQAGALLRSVLWSKLKSIFSRRP